MKWTVRDRFGNEIYMTEERRRHALEHDEMDNALLESVLQTIKWGRRRQEALNPNKYRYYRPFDDLPDDNNYVVVVTKFGFRFDNKGRSIPNNFVLTAYLVEEI